MDKESRIVVLGAGGLIGSEIVTQLKKNSYLSVKKSLHRELDLTNQLAVECFFEREKPEYVFFCAVNTITDFEKTNCINAVELYSNVMMQFNVMEAARKHGVKKAVFLGSAMLYPWTDVHGDDKWKEELLDEFSFLQYRPSMQSTVLSKFVSMKACQYFFEQYGSHYVYAIPSHIYGGYSGRKNLFFLERLVMDLCRAKVENKRSIQLDVFGDGKAKKQILHVSDCARAIITIIDCYEDYTTPINIASKEETCWNSIVQKVCSFLDYHGEVVFNSEHEERMENRICNVERLYNLGWKQEIELDYGLKLLCDECLSEGGYYA